MNHIYRLVWNHSTQSMVAVAENAKGRGKNGSKAKTLVTAVAGALLALSATQVIAIDNSITTSQGRLYLNTADTLTVGQSGTISDSGYGVTSNNGVLAGYITNAGSIHGSTTGIAINSGGTSSGGLSGNLVNLQGGRSVGIASVLLLHQAPL